jgi:hypothetical protein
MSKSSFLCIVETPLKFVSCRIAERLCQKKKRGTECGTGTGARGEGSRSAVACFDGVEAEGDQSGVAAEVGIGREDGKSPPFGGRAQHEIGIGAPNTRLGLPASPPR